MDSMNYQNFTPIKDLGDLGGKTLFEIPENRQTVMPNGIEFVREDEDIFKGKVYQWKEGPFVGQTSKAEKMIKKGTNYFVIFDTGQMVSTEDVQMQLRELVGGESDLNLRPNNYNGVADLDPLSTERERRKPPINPVFDPVIEILKKKKKSYTTVDIKMELDLPKMELYTLLLESYDNAEDKIIEYLFTDENINDIKEGIKISIRKKYGIEN